MLPFSQTIFKNALICLTFILVCMTSVESLGGASNDIGIVTVDALNFRPEPGFHKPPIKTLGKGEKVVVLDLMDGWLKIVHKKQIGYVLNKEKYIRVIKSEGNEKKLEIDNEPDLRSLKKESEHLNQRLRKSESKVSIFTKKEKAIVDGLNEIDRALNTLRKRTSLLKNELSELDKKIKKNQNIIDKLGKDMHVHEDYVNQRLVALYKLHRLGGMTTIVPSAESVHEFLNLKKTFESILAQDENTLGSYARNLHRFNELLEIQKKEKKQQKSLETELLKELRMTETEKEKRVKLLSHIQSQKRLELAAIDMLQQADRELNQKIASYITTSKKSSTRKKTMGNSFINFKGLLKMPVNGKIISYFGPYKNPKYKVVNYRSGINIKTDRGEPIRAVFAGKVLFSDWFKGYGNMMIIDHGDHYYSVYANIDELFKTTGSSVETEEVIATVGESGSLLGPKLYFEIRHHGEPLNPLNWIKAG